MVSIMVLGKASSKSAAALNLVLTSIPSDFAAFSARPQDLKAGSRRAMLEQLSYGQEVGDRDKAFNEMTSNLSPVGGQPAPGAVDSSGITSLTKDDLIAFETEIAAEFNQAKIRARFTCTAATRRQ